MEKCTGEEIGRLLALRWSRSVSFSKDSVMPHNLEDDPGRDNEDDRLCDGVNVVLTLTAQGDTEVV